MAEQLSTPRITAAYLDNFVGKVVMLVGKVTQLRGDQATLDSEGTVTVLLNRDAHLSNGNAVQVIGKVNPDLSIKVLTSRDLGSSVDHGPFQPAQAYAPRVAMVWTSPKRSDALRSSTDLRQASFNDKNGKSNLTTPNSDSTETIRSPKPLHNTYSAAQRLQRNTRSNYGSRPSTAMSFTTYSSDMIQGQDPGSRPYSPTLPSHISQTPTPSMGTLLPSPPEEIPVCGSYSPEGSRHNFSMPSHTPSQETYDQQDSQLPYIPSAQPYTPLAYSPPSMSSPSLLPSPPMTQSSDERYRSSHGPPMSPTISTSSHRHSELTGRRRPTYNAGGTTSLDSKSDGLSESEMFDSVLEGIGRIHVSMGRDDAGRWRIKRAADERP